MMYVVETFTNNNLIFIVDKSLCFFITHESWFLHGRMCFYKILNNVFIINDLDIFIRGEIIKIIYVS